MYGDSVSIVMDEVDLHSDQYHMAEFAKKYFREAQVEQRSGANNRAENMLRYLHI